MIKKIMLTTKNNPNNREWLGSKFKQIKAIVKEEVLNLVRCK